jgi:tRNA A37 N6-isopentenylltransferase MiaA
MSGENKIVERVAATCHTQWSSWMKYLFSKCDRHPTGEYTIPKWAVDRWNRQLATEYKDLPPEEQETHSPNDRKRINRVREIRFLVVYTIKYECKNR